MSRRTASNWRTEILLDTLAGAALSPEIFSFSSSRLLRSTEHLHCVFSILTWTGHVSAPARLPPRAGAARSPAACRPALACASSCPFALRVATAFR